MAKTRDLHYSALVVGGKGVGKSTYLASVAKKYPKASKVLIIDVNGSPAYNCFQQIQVNDIRNLKSGVVKLIGTPDRDTLKKIAQDFRNGLIIFEDCTKYIDGNPKPEIKAFLVDHRMYGCDLIFTFHSLKRVPPFFWEMTAYVTLFKTLENFDTGANRNRIPNFENMLKAYNKVNSHPDQRHKITVETMI